MPQRWKFLQVLSVKQFLRERIWNTSFRKKYLNILTGWICIKNKTSISYSLYTSILKLFIYIQEITRSARENSSSLRYQWQLPSFWERLMHFPLEIIRSAHEKSSSFRFASLPMTLFFFWGKTSTYSSWRFLISSRKAGLHSEWHRVFVMVGR